MSSQEQIREELRAAAATADAPPANGQPRAPKVIAGTSHPAPAPNSEVTILNAELPSGAKIKYDALAEDIPQAPKVSAYQQELIAQRTQSEAKTFFRARTLEEFVDYWKEFAEANADGGGYADVSQFKMRVTRLTDNIPLPGQPHPYLTFCSEERPLGEWPFTPNLNQFIGQIQTLNSGSGGRFRVSLIDATGELVKDTWYEDIIIRGQAVSRAIEGQQNGIWIGSIPNPINANPQQNREERKKAPTIKDLINELKEQKENLKELGIIKEESGSTNNSLLDSINAQAATSIITSLKDTLTAIHSTAGNSGSDKGFLRSLAEGDEGQKRIWSGFDNFTNMLSMVAGGWMKDRSERQAHRQRIEELKLIKENPELARIYEQQQQAQAGAQEQKEDIFDYVCRACEEKRTDFTLEDPKVKEMSASDVAMIRGALAKDSTPEEMLDLFIQVATFKGKGERAKALKSLPHTLQFIERLQRSVKGA